MIWLAYRPIASFVLKKSHSKQNQTKVYSTLCAGNHKVLLQKKSGEILELMNSISNTIYF